MANGMGSLPTTPTGDAPLAPLLAPRPAEPTQPLTARPFAWPEDGEADAPIERALGAYGYDQFQHAADRAFGEDLPGGAA